ncbi:MAG: RNA methyltransferase [SAR324 cluster bacterium]|uniref:RNA methyltransferase n=1 Tax=SAR324 cluster bacterium TaxID=2024889 RepID=A0A7X9FNU7_9DELT|nr:RNA methyltransferase [SAR324 cluster bacterium]
MSQFKNFRILLVEPEDNANIGAVARAMKNMGFEDLALITPSRYEFERAKITACNAIDLLKNVKTFDTIEEAVRDSTDVIGFSARTGKNRPCIFIDEWLESLRTRSASKTCLLFGPEESGLHDKHIEQCRNLVRIPTNPRCSSLNLAQAVLIVLYELSKNASLFPRGSDNSRLVEWEEFFHLDHLVNEVLIKCGFYNKGTPPHLPQVIGNLFRRSLPNKREMKILQGIFGRILKSL